jgi:RHS repeat-associated protein
VIQPTSQTNGYDAFNVSGNLTLPNGKEGAYDYFILDYQSNVRMVVTEQQQSASNIATMETARSGQEAPVFGQTGPANELEASRFATPSAWNNATVGQQVSRLGTLSGRTLGPNTLQKVMAGDKISATVQYFHQATPGASSPISTVVLNTLGQLLSGTNSVSSIVKGNATAITSQLGANPGFIDAVQPTGAGGNTPQAYLTILFFDERFNFISAADGGVAQQQVAASVGAGGSTLGLGNIKAPKNGYAMVYVSNRSEQPVYFDNLQVGKVAGNILEENHYYAYGLRIAAISSRKFGDVSEGEIVNQFLYNGKEMLDEDADLGWIDYGFRNYDPQIGRFQQADPISDELSSFSLYHYAFNDPIGNIDYMGLAGVDPIKVLGMVKDAVVTQNSFLKEIVIKAPRITKAAKTGLETASKSKLLEGAVKLAWGSIDFINTYANPITPIFEFVSGKDFNHGNFDIDKPRLESAAEAGTYFVGGKIVSGAVKSFSKPVINSLYKSTLKGSSEAAAKRGWKVGDAISNLTAKGNIPSWSTVRQRFWKNEEFLNASKYSQNNLLRMQKGLAPQRLNPNTGLMESMELHHHILPQRNGGLFDFMKVWPDEHRAIDPFRR